MSGIRLLLPLLLLLAARSTLAHDLQHTVTGGQAVVIRLFFVDNTPFAFEGYEIYQDGGKLPYQVGRTDSRGRIAFLPDKAATWRVRVFSEDGHGLDFKLDTNAASVLTSSEKPAFERYGRVAAGVAVILGLFGLLSLYVKRKVPK